MPAHIFTVADFHIFFDIWKSGVVYDEHFILALVARTELQVYISTRQV